MACKCYCNARSGWGIGYRDEELTKSLANTIVCKNATSKESSIAWDRQNFVKCFCEMFLLSSGC